MFRITLSEEEFIHHAVNCVSIGINYYVKLPNVLCTELWIFNPLENSYTLEKFIPPVDNKNNLCYTI